MELRAEESTRKVPVLHVSGDVDLSTADGLQTAAEEILHRCAGLMIIDLSGVTFLDSSGLRALDEVQRKAVDLDASVALVCPERRLVKLLEITGLDQRFAIHATTEGAVDAASNEA